MAMAAVLDNVWVYRYRRNESWLNAGYYGEWMSVI